MNRDKPRIALVHDWLTGMRGGEKVLEQQCRLFPDAEIFTLVARHRQLTPQILSHRIHTSWLQEVPLTHLYYRWLLPLMPRAIESLRVAGFDAVISNHHCVAKSVRCGSTPHLCYCLTPMRYLYQTGQYFKGRRGVVPAACNGGLRLCRKRLERWDKATANRVSRYISISTAVESRVRTIYARNSTIVAPPVDTEFYAPDPATPREDFCLVVSALVPYKRVDLAIAAARIGGFHLKVVGKGPESTALRRRAAGADVEFLGWQDDAAVRDLYRRARFLLYPQLEDFGITAVEAQACGTPVLAFGQGGALDTVKHTVTGRHFTPQTPEGLAEAVRSAWDTEWCHAAIRRHAETFSADRFRREFQQEVEALLAETSAADPSGGY